MGTTLGILEDLDTTERHRVGRLFDVPVAVTPLAWLSPVLMLGQGVALSLGQRHPDGAARLAAAGQFALAGQIVNLSHAVGHVVSGRLAGAPMDELLITATRIANRYEGDQERYGPRIHLSRALGGPAANLLLAALLAAWLRRRPAGLGRDFAERLLALNLIAGLGALLPLPSVDGAVIWRQVATYARRPTASIAGSITASSGSGG
jgi:Zn-dependent protease